MVSQREAGCPQLELNNISQQAKLTARVLRSQICSSSLADLLTGVLLLGL